MLEGVTVRLHHSKVKVEDGAEGEHQDAKGDLIKQEIELRGPLSQEQRDRLLYIAIRCPLHRTLSCGS